MNVQRFIPHPSALIPLIMPTYKLTLEYEGTRYSGWQAQGNTPKTIQGRLLRAMMTSIAEVVDANQPTINTKGTGFKGFIPSTFGRLVGEAFARAATGEAEVKVTAPAELIRNRRARPDAWEADIIHTKLLAPGWPRGQAFSDLVRVSERDAFRVMVPEYYAASCLSCHGEPKGEMDKTGYPKEGSKVDDLGGVISITLYH